MKHRTLLTKAGDARTEGMAFTADELRTFAERFYPEFEYEEETGALYVFLDEDECAAIKRTDSLRYFPVDRVFYSRDPRSEGVIKWPGRKVSFAPRFLKF